MQATVNNSCNIEKLLITKEAYWSAQLFSLAPFGLNKCQEFHSKKEFTTINVEVTRKIGRLSKVPVLDPVSLVSTR